MVLEATFLNHVQEWLRTQKSTIKMAQQVKAFWHKPDDLSSIPGTQVQKEDVVACMQSQQERK